MNLKFTNITGQQRQINGITNSYVIKQGKSIEIDELDIYRDEVERCKKFFKVKYSPPKDRPSVERLVIYTKPKRKRGRPKGGNK